MATLSNPANLVSESSSSSTSATAGPSKKRKADNKQDNEGKKRLPSCDLCRARKVKCVKNEGSPRCEGCQSLNQRCEYTYERRKPGPVNSFAKKPSPPPFVQPYPPEEHRYDSMYVPPPIHLPAPNEAISIFGTNPFEDPFAMDTTWAHNVDPLTTRSDLPFLPMSPTTLLNPMPGEQESTDGSPADVWPWNMPNWDPTAHSTSSSGNGWDGRGSVPDTHLKGKAKAKADRGVEHIEAVIEWGTMMRILHAYHAHLYPLLPIVHWPSFSQQLIARDDERSDSYRAFLLALVAYSIIQLPRSALGFIPVPDLRRIHQRCYAESRKLQNRRYTTVHLVDITTLYCQHIYLGTLGRTHAANVLLADAIRLAFVIGIHDERLPRGTFDVVEREMRRRTFWLLYGSDRTISALTSDPMQIYDADICLPPPMSLDDNLFTPSGAFPQPAGTTPVLAGFHFNTRLFRLLGALLTSYKEITAPSADANTDPYPILHLPQYAPPRPRPARQFLEELERILLELPPPLQLFNPLGEPTPNGSMDGEQNPRDAAAFGTCRANLLVTQALVRFAVRQYAKAIGEPDAGEPGKEWAEKDVLGLLEAMSPESLAANGESLRHKVLFVASSLLEKYPSTTEGHNYVTDFLSVYTRISQEQHLSLLEPDRSGEVSRDQSPLPRGV